MGWIIRNNELTESEFNDEIYYPSYPLTAPLWRTGESGLQTGFYEGVVFPSSPLAPALWHVDPENGLVTGFLNEIPYRDDNWKISGGELKTKYMADTIYLGACANNIQLYSVTIPKSVKRIGRYAFYNTLINHVTIASDCTYYPTSFPEGTVIERYPDEEEGENDG